MKRIPRPYRRKEARRAGFTLIEMLIVISIIGLLAALSIGAAIMLIGTQKRSTTQQVIQKTAAALDQQWKAVVDQARYHEQPSQAEYITSASNIITYSWRRHTGLMDAESNS